MPWYGSKNTWKNIGKSIGDTAKGAGEGLYKGSKGVVNEVWTTGKTSVTEVWNTGKGVLTTAEGLVSNVGNTVGALGNPLYLFMLIGGIVLIMILR